MVTSKIEIEQIYDMHKRMKNPLFSSPPLNVIEAVSLLTVILPKPSERFYFTVKLQL